MPNQIENLITEHSDKQTKLQKFLDSIAQLDKLLIDLDKQACKLQDQGIITDLSYFQERCIKLQCITKNTVEDCKKKQEKLKEDVAKKISAICAD